MILKKTRKFKKSTQMQNNKTSGITRRALAIDPGFDRMGVAVVALQDGKEILLHSECIKTNSKDKREIRLKAIGLGVRKIISKWKPEELAIETLFFNTNTTSAIGVAEARGVAIFESATANLEVFEYGPQAIKAAVTGYGRANKSQVETMIKQLIKLPDQTKGRLDDEIDAIAVGITHLVTRRYPHKAVRLIAK
jgi:crossover junction endodeoxyribonuclease RuvC